MSTIILNELSIRSLPRVNLTGSDDTKLFKSQIERSLYELLTQGYGIVFYDFNQGLFRVSLIQDVKTGKHGYAFIIDKRDHGFQDPNSRYKHDKVLLVLDQIIDIFNLNSTSNYDETRHVYVYNLWER